jgi:ketosteroid isomerase-like protein
MSTETNKQVALRLLDSLSAGKFDDVLACMNDTATWTVPLASRSLPALEGAKTKAAFGTQMRQFSSVMPNGVKMTVKGVTAEGDRVAVEAECYAVTSVGTEYKNLYHFLFEMRGGKVEAVKEYCDLLHVKEVLSFAFA